MQYDFDPRLKPIITEAGLDDFTFTRGLLQHTISHKMITAANTLLQHGEIDNEVVEVMMRTLIGAGPADAHTPRYPQEVPEELRWQPQAWSMRQPLPGKPKTGMHGMEALTQEEAEQVYSATPGFMATYTPQGEKAFWTWKPPSGGDWSDAQQAASLMKAAKLGTHRAVALAGPDLQPLQRIESLLKVGSWEQSPSYRFKANMIWTGITSQVMPEGQIVGAQHFTGTDVATLRVSNYAGGPVTSLSFDDVIGSAEKIMTRGDVRQLGSTGDWDRVKFLAAKIVQVTQQYGRQSMQARVFVQRYVNESGLKADYIKGMMGGVAENPSEYGIPNMQSALQTGQPQVITNITNIKQWMAVPERLLTGVVWDLTTQKGFSREQALEKLGLSEEILTFVPGAGKRVPEEWIRACEKIARNSNGMNYVDMATGNMNLPMLGDFTRQGASIAKKNRWSPEAARLMRDVDPIGYAHAVQDPYNKRITGHYQNVLTAGQNLGRQLASEHLARAGRWNLSTMTAGGINLAQEALVRANSGGQRMVSGSLYAALGELITEAAAKNQLGLAGTRMLNPNRMMQIDTFYHGKAISLDIMSPKDAAYFQNKDQIRRHLVVSGNGAEYQQALQEWEQASSRLVSSFEDIIQHQVRYGNSRPDVMDRLIDAHAKQLEVMQRSRATQMTAQSVFIKQGVMATGTGSFNLGFNELALGDDLLEKHFGSQIGKDPTTRTKRLAALRNYLEGHNVSTDLMRNPDITRNQILRVRLVSMLRTGLSSARGMVLHPILASQTKGDLDGDMYASYLSTRLKIDPITGEVIDIMGSASPRPQTEREMLLQVADASKLRGGGYHELVSSLTKLGVPKETVVDLTKAIDAGNVDLAHSLLLNLTGDRPNERLISGLRAAYNAPMATMEQGGAGREFTAIAKKYMGIAYNFNRQLQVTGSSTGKSESYAKFVEIIYKANQDQERMSPGLTRFLDFMSRYQPASGGLRRGGYENDIGFMGHDADQAMLEAVQGIFGSTEFSGANDRALLASIVTEDPRAQAILTVSGDRSNVVAALGLNPWSNAHKLGIFMATLKSSIAAGWKHRIESGTSKPTDTSMTEADIRASFIGEMLRSSLYVEGRKWKGAIPEYDPSRSAAENLNRTRAAIDRHELVDAKLRARSFRDKNWMWQEIDPSTAPRPKVIWHNPLTDKDQEFDEPMPGEISFAAGWTDESLVSAKSVLAGAPRMNRVMLSDIYTSVRQGPNWIRSLQSRAGGHMAGAFGPGPRGWAIFLNQTIMHKKGVDPRYGPVHTTLHELGHETEDIGRGLNLIVMPPGGEDAKNIFRKHYNGLLSVIDEEWKRNEKAIRGDYPFGYNTEEAIKKEMFADAMAYAAQGMYTNTKLVQAATKLQLASRDLDQYTKEGDALRPGEENVSFADTEETDQFGEESFQVSPMLAAAMDMLRHGPKGIARRLSKQAQQGLSYAGSAIKFGASSIKTWVMAARREIIAGQAALGIPALAEATQAWMEQGRMHLTLQGMSPVSPSYADSADDLTQRMRGQLRGIGYVDLEINQLRRGEAQDILQRHPSSTRILFNPVLGPARESTGGDERTSLLPEDVTPTIHAGRPAGGKSTYAAMHGTAQGDEAIQIAALTRHIMVSQGVEDIHYKPSFAKVAKQAVRDALGGRLEYANYSKTIGAENVGWKALETLSAQTKGIASPMANIRSAGNIALDMLAQTKSGGLDLIDEIKTRQSAGDLAKQARAAFGRTGSATDVLNAIGGSEESVKSLVARANAVFGPTPKGANAIFKSWGIEDEPVAGSGGGMGVGGGAKRPLNNEQMDKLARATDVFQEAFDKAGSAVKDYTAEQVVATKVVAKFADRASGAFADSYAGMGQQARDVLEMGGMDLNPPPTGRGGGGGGGRRGGGGKQQGIGAMLGIGGLTGMWGLRQVTGGIGDILSWGAQATTAQAAYGANINQALAVGGIPVGPMSGGMGGLALGQQQFQNRLQGGLAMAGSPLTGWVTQNQTVANQAAIGKMAGEAFWATAMPLAMMGGPLAPAALPIGAVAAAATGLYGAYGQSKYYAEHPQADVMQRYADQVQARISLQDGAFRGANIGPIAPALTSGASAVQGLIDAPTQENMKNAGSALAREALKGIVEGYTSFKTNEFVNGIMQTYGVGAEQGYAAAGIADKFGGSYTANIAQVIAQQNAGINTEGMLMQYAQSFGGGAKNAYNAIMGMNITQAPNIQLGMTSQLFQAQALAGGKLSTSAMAGVGAMEAPQQFLSGAYGQLGTTAQQNMLLYGIKPPPQAKANQDIINQIAQINPSQLDPKSLEKMSDDEVTQWMAHQAAILTGKLQNYPQEQITAQRQDALRQTFSAGGNTDLGALAANMFGNNPTMAQIAMNAAGGNEYALSATGRKSLTTKEAITGLDLYSTQSQGITPSGLAQGIWGGAQGLDTIGKALGQSFTDFFAQSDVGKAWLQGGSRQMGWQMQATQAANQMGQLGISTAQANFQYTDMVNGQPGYVQAQRALALQQFQENWALSSQQTQTGYQFQQVGFGHEQQMAGIQHGYSQQDIAFQRSQTARGFGEQMWEYSFEMPYLTGRERQKAEHEKAYDIGSYNIDQGHQTVLANREKQQYDLQVLWLGTIKAQSQVNHNLDMQGLTLQKKHYMENYALEGKSFDMEKKWALDRLALDTKMTTESISYNTQQTLLNQNQEDIKAGIAQMMALDWPGWLEKCRLEIAKMMGIVDVGTPTKSSIAGFNPSKGTPSSSAGDVTISIPVVIQGQAVANAVAVVAKKDIIRYGNQSVGVRRY